MIRRDLRDQWVDNGDDIHASIRVQVDHFERRLSGVGHQFLNIILLEDQVHEQLIAAQMGGQGERAADQAIEGSVITDG